MATHTLQARVGRTGLAASLPQQARGELFFFTDADTQHQPGTLRAIVTTLLGERADLLTGFLCKEGQTWGERLLVPFFSWVKYLIQMSKSGMHPAD
jgi:chlorobactene glucosyltransferase